MKGEALVTWFGPEAELSGVTVSIRTVACLVASGLPALSVE